MFARSALKYFFFSSWLCSKYVPRPKLTDFIAAAYVPQITDLKDMGMAELKEAKQFVQNGKFGLAIEPLQRISEIFAGYGEKGLAWKLPVDLLLSYCQHQCGHQADSVQAAADVFQAIEKMDRQKILEKPDHIAFVAWFLSCLSNLPASPNHQLGAKLTAEINSKGPSSPAAAVHFNLLYMLLSNDHSVGMKALECVCKNASQLSPEDASNLTALAHGTAAQVALRNLNEKQSKVADEYKEVVKSYQRGLDVLTTKYGAERFDTTPSATAPPTPTDAQLVAMDLFTSLLSGQASAYASLAQNCGPPDPSLSPEKRGPDPQGEAAILLSKALALNRLVDPDHRFNRKAEAIMKQLYDLYSSIGIYIQASGIFNSLQQCVRHIHGEKSPEVVALLKQHVAFLTSLGTKEHSQEADGVKAQIEELEAAIGSKK